MSVSSVVSLARGLEFVSKAHLPFLAIFVFIIVIYKLLLHPLIDGSLSHVPGPWLNKVTHLHLAFYTFTYRRNEKIHEWHTLYGPVICISPGMVSVASLEGTKEIYRATQGWAKSDHFDHFTEYNERPIFATLPHLEHRNKRKLTAAFYSESTIFKSSDLEDYVAERCQAVAGQIAARGTVDVYSLADWYAVDIITHLAFGPGHATRSVEHAGPERRIFKNLKRQQFLGSFKTCFPVAFSSISSVLQKRFSSLDYLGVDQEFAAWCRQRVSDAAKDPLLSPHSLLGRLMSSASETAATKRVSDDFIAAEILDNINAAEATVSVTATYLLWQLGRHPAWQERIWAELRALPVRRHGLPAFADVHGQAPALEACLRKTYRLYPASSGRAERCVPVGGSVLAGVYLPPGTVAANSVVHLHRDPAVFPDPAAFAPERWLRGGDGRGGEAQLLPFGYGGRVCLDRPLATLQLKMLVVTLCLSYEIRPTTAATPASMWQTNTHDAVPWALKCLLEFQSRGRDPEYAADP